MLLSSYFILNRCGLVRLINARTGWSIGLTRTNEIRKHKLYPYVHSFSNVPTRQTMLHPVYIPDVLPSALPPGSNFSLVAGESRYSFQLSVMCISTIVGDFEEIYGVDTDPREPHSGQWDAVLTCFFIDTVRALPTFPVSHNIIIRFLTILG
jgi:carnosine N-methyltransferase